jgi:hypothetical protein
MSGFLRWPELGADYNVWANFLLPQLQASVGLFSGRLVNSGGTLTLPVCHIGIDSGTSKGIIETGGDSIGLSGCSNSNWIAIEISVAGTTYTLTATDIAGATDPTIIPASVRAAWDGLKGGFYLTASKRLIGLAWKDAGGVLIEVFALDQQLDPYLGEDVDVKSVLSVGRRIDCFQVSGGASDLQIAQKVGSGQGASFTVKRPILCHFVSTIVLPSVANMRALQAAGWGNIHGTEASQSGSFSFMLCPGVFAIYNGGNGTSTLYAAGVYGAAQLVLSEIVA